MKIFLVCWLVIMLDVSMLIGFGVIIGNLGLWYLYPFLLIAQILVASNISTIIDKFEYFFSSREH